MKRFITDVEDEQKYPIKYGVMPINELDQDSEIIAYIVSKCYVISEKKTYLCNGTYKITYEVVFPYKMDRTKNSRRAMPQYNIYSQCINSIVINQVFDSFEDASIVADKLNEGILHHEIGCLFFDDNFETKAKSIETKHQETLDRVKAFESYVENETKDMVVTKTLSTTLEKIIESLDNPNEFYNRLFQVLSFEEREYLKQEIDNRSCDNCINGSCTVKHCEKVGLDETGQPQGRNCVGWNNPELIGRQRILEKHSL